MWCDRGRSGTSTLWKTRSARTDAARRTHADPVVRRARHTACARDLSALTCDDASCPQYPPTAMTTTEPANGSILVQHPAGPLPGDNLTGADPTTSGPAWQDHLPRQVVQDARPDRARDRQSRRLHGTHQTSTGEEPAREVPRRTRRPRRGRRLDGPQPPDPPERPGARRPADRGQLARGRPELAVDLRLRDLGPGHAHRRRQRRGQGAGLRPAARRHLPQPARTSRSSGASTARRSR